MPNPKIGAIGGIILGLVAIVVIALLAMNFRDPSEVGRDQRRAYVDDIRSLFDDREDVRLEGDNDVGLLFRDVQCNRTRNERYAQTRRVRSAGFQWVRCLDGERVEIK